MTHDAERPARAPRTDPVAVRLRWLAEEAPGAAWAQVFWNGWPGWSGWLGERAGGEADLARAERALRRHMPEFVPVWERLVAVVGGDVRAACFLTFWSPPRYLMHCAQAVVVDEDGPCLIRNYDLDPRLLEGVLFRTAWGSRPVIGMVDGLAGLSDGMNAAGLAVSLAFGGRAAHGQGFGVPLILRYVLQMCRDVQDGVEALRALPCHMAYNLTLVDASGAHATVLMSPDRPALVLADRFATNHQLGVEWPWHGRLSQSAERFSALAAAMGDGPVTATSLLHRFLSPPLHSTRYGEGFGTLFTALYRPAQGRMELHWPGLPSTRQSFADFREGSRELVFTHGRLAEEPPRPHHPSHSFGAAHSAA
jgi:predicted choloylglycine hydrolase